MSSAKNRFADFITEHDAKIALGFIIVLVLFVRVRLREMPLERDEGEYAYAGQLLLQGVPPYKLAYNMKLPGTYAAYALIMMVFGQTDSGIHLGLALVNIVTIAMIFLMGRRVLDATAGAVAALAYGLLSTSPAFLGLAGHATHFVVFCAMAGALLLLKARETEKAGLFLASGLMFGFAFLMKQHGVFFGVFGLGYVLWQNLVKDNMNWGRCVREFGMMLGGLLLPFTITCAALAAMGVFKPFWFWTFTYAKEYAAAVSLDQLPKILQAAMESSVGLNAIFWVLAAVGAVMMWWEKRLRAALPFVAGFALAGVLALCAGMYFRHHYFILLLPVVALLNGVVVSRALFLIRKENKSVELFLALGGLVLYGLAVLVAIALHGEEWFSASPVKVSESTYHSNLFSETRRLALDLRAELPPGARVVVLGSEPQIYFYAQRRSASGYIYTYALMESHPYAQKMQKEMIREIETSRPEYVVNITDASSWARHDGSADNIFRWWEGYWSEHYELLRSIPVMREQLPGQNRRDSAVESQPQSTGLLMLLKRRDAAVAPRPVAQ